MSYLVAWMACMLGLLLSANAEVAEDAQDVREMNRDELVDWLVDSGSLGPRDGLPSWQESGVTASPRGKACLERVEAIEAEDGVLFDDHKMSDKARALTAAKLSKLCESLFGNSKPDFEQSL